ncbi:MAG: hypothetical protein IIC67_09030 [Thaumarchaeota archaeon]|nr:hypothetical protein [Nitrososphaerota archaeon]
MAIDGFGPSSIIQARVDPDAPLDTTLFTEIRDGLEFMQRWMGKSGLSTATADHAHKGFLIDGTQAIAGIGGGVQVALSTKIMPEQAGTLSGAQPFVDLDMLSDVVFAWNLGAGSGPGSVGNGVFKQTIDTNFHSGFQSQSMSGGTYLNTQGIKQIIKGGLFFDSSAAFYIAGNLAQAWFLKRKTGMIAIDVYTGNGSTSKPITGLGFPPKFVWVFSIQNENNGSPNMKSFSMLDGVDGIGLSRDTVGNTRTDGILSLESDGFIISNDSTVNENDDRYMYIAFPAQASSDGEELFITSYLGDGVDGREISGNQFDDELIFTPDLVLVTRTDSTSGPPFIHTREMGVLSINMAGGGILDRVIKGIITNGLE